MLEAEWAVFGSKLFIQRNRRLLDECARFRNGAQNENGDAGKDGGGHGDGMEAMTRVTVNPTGKESGDDEGPYIAEAESGLQGGAALRRAEFGREGEVTDAVDEQSKTEDKIGTGENGEGLGLGDPEAEQKADDAGGEEEDLAAAAIAQPAC